MAQVTGVNLSHIYGGGLHAVERSQGTVIKGHTEFSGLFVNKVCFTVFQSVRIISFGQRTIL